MWFIEQINTHAKSVSIENLQNDITPHDLVQTLEQCPPHFRMHILSSAPAAFTKVDCVLIHFIIEI